MASRAVANGPVGPAMAGPIIEPANFILFFIIFFGRNNNRAGIFSILFLKQRRHSRQNVHSDDSILGRFRPSHAGSHHHSMGGKGPQVHAFVGLYSDHQCDAGTITAVVTYMCSSDWTYLWTSFADSATSFADSATSFADSATMELATWVDRERVCVCVCC